MIIKKIILLILSFACCRDILFLSCLESFTNIRISSFTVLYNIIAIICANLTKRKINRIFLKPYESVGRGARTLGLSELFYHYQFFRPLPLGSIRVLRVSHCTVSVSIWSMIWTVHIWAYCQSIMWAKNPRS